MIVVELFEVIGHRPVMEIHVPEGRNPGGIGRDGIPDVIEYKGRIFIRVFDGSSTPHYVEGNLYHAS